MVLSLPSNPTCPNTCATLSPFYTCPVWRLSEMKALEWRDVDLSGRVVRLRPEISKNKDGRVLPLSGELQEIMERAAAKRRPDCRFVFHRDGETIGRLSQGIG
jgi:integrase